MTPQKPLKYRDVVTSHLREDTRILSSVLAMRRIFKTPQYEIFLSIYSGLMDNSRLHSDLVTCLIIFKDESLRIMIKLWTDEIDGNRQAYIEQAVIRLKKEGKGPLHLIKDAKVWCHLPFTQRDRQFLAAGGVKI